MSRKRERSDEAEAVGSAMGARDVMFRSVRCKAPRRIGFPGSRLRLLRRYYTFFMRIEKARAGAKNPSVGPVTGAK